MPRRSAADVADSRASAVEAAIDLASVEGLEGITIGRLAGELAHEQERPDRALRRQAGHAAGGARRRRRAVHRRGLAPGQPVRARLPRLEAIVDAWIAHLRDGVFPGGCFVTTASVEYDSRPGPLHDDVAEAVRRWLGVLEAEARGRARPATCPPTAIPPTWPSSCTASPRAAALPADCSRTPPALDRTRAAMRRAIGLPS